MATSMPLLGVIGKLPYSQNASQTNCKGFSYLVAPAPAMTILEGVLCIVINKYTIKSVHFITYGAHPSYLYIRCAVHHLTSDTYIASLSHRHFDVLVCVSTFRSSLLCCQIPASAQSCQGLYSSAKGYFLDTSMLR